MSEQGCLERVLQVDTRQLRLALPKSPAWRPPTRSDRQIFEVLGKDGNNFAGILC
jgi:hypothetical protein